jgi:uncharacterized protein involved in exopolysaccharide biosynthesis
MIEVTDLVPDPGTQGLGQRAEVPGSKDSNALQSIKITQILRLLWLKRGTVGSMVATGMVISVVYALLLPPKFTSTTSLMPPQNSSTGSSLMSLLSAASPAVSAGSAMLGVKTPGALFTGILGSRSVQESLVNRFGLIQYYKVKYMEDACKRLAADTSAQENTRTGIISIRVTAKSPGLASEIAQGYVTELNRVVVNNSTSSARRERMFLEERLKQIKLDLDDSSRALSEFSAKNKTIDMPSQAKSMVEAGLKLEDALVTARAELAGLRQTYSEDNVRVRSASARVGELQRQMDYMIGLNQGRGSGLDASEAGYPSLGELPALGLTYADLSRRVRVEEAVWEALTKQYETAKVQEAKDIPTVQVLDAASVPARKSAPVRSTIVILGGALSFFAACLFVFGKEAWANMDSQDERKQLANEFLNGIADPKGWVSHIPGKRWAFARLKPPPA